MTAKAITAQHQVGETKIEILTQQPIVVQPNLPRVLTVGDQVMLAASVHNYRDETQRLDVSLQGEALDGIVKAIAAGLLIGLLKDVHPEPLNYISAPVIADKMGIQISQTIGQSPVNYPNLVSCRVGGDGWERLIVGVLFAGGEPRIVRLNAYDVDARPEGHILLMQNKDVPGVVGQIGTILAAYEVNIGEWRMGRDKPGGKALSFINLDSDVPPAALDALGKISAVTRVKLISL